MPPNGPPQGPYSQPPPRWQPPPGAPPQPAYPMYPPPYAPLPPNEPSAITAMVLGIIGVAVCQVTAPIAWVLGNKSLANIRQNPGMYQGEAMAKAGQVMGIIGTILLILVVLYFVFVFSVVFGSLRG